MLHVRLVYEVSVAPVLVFGLDRPESIKAKRAASVPGRWYAHVEGAGAQPLHVAARPPLHATITPRYRINQVLCISFRIR